METGTFPNVDVQAHIKRNFIPVKFESGKDAAQFTKFSIFITPAFFVLDAKGDVLYRMVGYFNPEDFTGHLTTARQIIGKL